MGFILLCSLNDSVSVAGPGFISDALTPSLTLLERTFLWAYINTPESRAGLVCKALETSDWLICLEPEKMKVPGLVRIRESGQLEKNLCFGEGF